MNVTVPPRLGKDFDSSEYDRAVNSATSPASRKASGAAPLVICTDSPRTAKMPPPTMPPTPIATAPHSPIGREAAASDWGTVAAYDAVAVRCRFRLGPRLAIGVVDALL